MTHTPSMVPWCHRCDEPLSCSSSPLCRAGRMLRGSRVLSSNQFFTHTLFCRVLQEPMDLDKSPLWLFLLGLKAGGSGLAVVNASWRNPLPWKPSS